MRTVRLYTIFGALLLTGLLAWSEAAAQGPELRAYVDRTPVPLNQQFELSVEFSGADANQAPQPSPPDLSGFATYLGSGSSQNIQIVNGRMSVSRTLTFHFIATKAGTHTIPSIQIDYQGKTYATDAIRIEVVQGSTPGRSGAPPSTHGGSPNAPDANDFSDYLFLRAAVDKKRVYQNEPVVVTYRIYTALNVQRYGISKLPSTVGFWREEFELPNPPTMRDEVINGRRYRVAEIKKMALFPQSAGEHTIEPLVIECDIEVRRRRNRRDLFDNFFDDPFFGFSRTERRTLASNALTIDVRPLPEANKPANFTGAVGDFTLSATVDKPAVQVNEAITYRLTVAGTGNIKFLPEPKVAWPRDFEVYDPKISERIERTGGVIRGEKTFEYLLIPRFPGGHVLGPIRYAYFDLGTESYKTLTADPITIEVAKGDDQPIAGPGIPGSKEDVRLIGQDIRFIEMRVPEFERLGETFYKSWFFYGALIMPLLVVGGAVAYRRHADKLSSNVAYARKRRANQMALKRLKAAKKRMHEGNARGFYGEVSKALMGFIGDKFNVAAAGLITDQVEAMLRSRGVQEEVSREFINCLKNCEFRRFAPEESDNGELKEFFERSKKAIVNLEKEI